MIFGVGTDIIEISRVNKAARREAFLYRVFTEKEISACHERGDFFASLAARFAAKEAVVKALGTGFRGYRWHDIEVVSANNGCPAVFLTGRAREWALSQGIVKIHISMSHNKEYAVAFCVAEGGR